MPASDSQFPETRKSLIMRASFSGGCDKSLSELAAQYWEPVYAFFRRCQRSPSDAEDMTQEVLSRLGQPGGKASLERFPTDGSLRFREWLVRMARDIQSDTARAENRKKRGGEMNVSGGDNEFFRSEFSTEDGVSRLEHKRAIHVQFDVAGAEDRLTVDGDMPVTPEQAFDRAWTRSLLARVLVKFTADEEARGHGDLLPFLLDDDESRPEYADVAAKFGTSAPALHSEVHRMRGRYELALKDEVAQVLKSEFGRDAFESEVDQELTDLSATLI